MIGSDLESKSYSATNDLIEMKNAQHNSKIYRFYKGPEA